MRINKFLASGGVSSRRYADILIKSGQVQVNGQVITKLGIDVDVQKDIVTVNGKPCVLDNNFIYIALNKPTGYVCTHAQFRGEKSIFKLLPRDYQKLKIAGRLDKESEGLLILSNDGNFIYQLTHPKFKHAKEYEVTLDRSLSRDEITKLKFGVRLAEGSAKADKLKYLGGNKYSLVIHQGWKRQIRRMFEMVGKKIYKLKRVRIEKLLLVNLAIGKYRKVAHTDIADIV
ncbi:rRNA pseudouridine synthase [Patescibacteria group bacterium]|nr:rRNA pseudouridine synthase [Patescibacteria group bacterium]